MNSKVNERSEDSILNLKGGTLITGSLLWQDHLKNEDEDNIRKFWREAYLLIKNKIMVKVPIRYGRLSTVSNIYTMTFSNSVVNGKLGTGFFVPFRQTPIASFNDLFNQAKEISLAEGMKGQFIGLTSNSKIWCVLGILINPKIENTTIAKSIYEKWNEAIKKEGGFNAECFRKEDETPCITENGKLNFQWPDPLDKRNAELLNNFDFLIATATKPTNYPSLEDLRNAVHSDKTRYYFIENYNSGITTFQDFELINKL
jgi:hypothetical protein